MEIKSAWPVNAISVTVISNCSKDGVEEFLTKFLCSFEQISQSNQSKLNVMQDIMVKNSCPPSLPQSTVWGCFPFTF